jgi:hypothetical protein
MAGLAGAPSLCPVVPSSFPVHFFRSQTKFFKFFQTVPIWESDRQDAGTEKLKGLHHGILDSD